MSLEPGRRSSPINSLSDDVLAVIFEICHMQWGARGFEITLSHVSRRWRALALSLSCLWSNITTTFQPIDELETYLARSHNRLLEIHLKSRQNLPSERAEGDTSLIPSLHLLIHHVERWRVLIIEPHSYFTLLKIVRSLRMLCAPNLTTFRICYRYQGSEGYLQRAMHSVKSFIFTGGAPCLSSVKCAGVSLECCWPPLEAVTDLQLDGPLFFSDVLALSPVSLTQDGFRKIFASTPNLTKLRLTGEVVEIWHNHHIPMIELTSLDTLHLDFDGYPKLALAFVSALSCPSITSLILGAMPEETTKAFLNGLPELGGASKWPLLRYLEFDWTADLDSDIPVDIDFALALPAVTHLRCIAVESAPKFLRFLATEVKWDSNDVPYPWSKLTKLSLDSYRTDQVSLGLLRELVHIRDLRGHPIETVELSSSCVEMVKRDEYLTAKVKVAFV